MQKFKAIGVLQFLNIFMDLLKSKKLVALFSDYEAAKNDVIFEILSYNKDLNTKDLEDLIKKLEEIIDFEEYFEDL